MHSTWFLVYYRATALQRRIFALQWSFHNQGFGSGREIDQRAAGLLFVFCIFRFLEFLFDKTETGIYQVWWDC